MGRILKFDRDPVPVTPPETDEATPEDRDEVAKQIAEAAKDLPADQIPWERLGVELEP